MSVDDYSDEVSKSSHSSLSLLGEPVYSPVLPDWTLSQKEKLRKKLPELLALERLIAYAGDKLKWRSIALCPMTI